MPNGGGNYVYQYNLKDHLGNNRVSFYSNSGTAVVIQEDEYYAFGLRRGLYDASNNNRYLYNGKELQTDLSNQYDYGARFYDPVIARWTSVDPLAEKGRRWSPYVYGDDNPIRNIDPDGMETVDGDPRKNVKNATYAFHPLIFKINEKEKTGRGIAGYSVGGNLTTKIGTLNADLTGFSAFYSGEKTNNSIEGHAKASALEASVETDITVGKLNHKTSTELSLFKAEANFKGEMNINDVTKPLGFSFEAGAEANVAKATYTSTFSAFGFSISSTTGGSTGTAEAGVKAGMHLTPTKFTMEVGTNFGLGEGVTKGYKFEIDFTKLLK